MKILLCTILLSLTTYRMTAQRTFPNVSDQKSGDSVSIAISVMVSEINVFIGITFEYNLHLWHPARDIPVLVLKPGLGFGAFYYAVELGFSLYPSQRTLVYFPFGLRYLQGLNEKTEGFSSTSETDYYHPISFADRCFMYAGIGIQFGAMNISIEYGMTIGKPVSEHHIGVDENYFIARRDGIVALRFGFGI